MISQKGGTNMMKGNTEIIKQQIRNALKTVNSSREEILKSFLYFKDVLDKELIALNQKGVDKNRYLCLEEIGTLEEEYDCFEKVSREAVNHLISNLNEMINKGNLEVSKILEVDDTLYLIYYKDFFQKMETLCGIFRETGEASKRLEEIQASIQEIDKE